MLLLHFALPPVVLAQQVLLVSRADVDEASSASTGDGSGKTEVGTVAEKPVSRQEGGSLALAWWWYSYTR